MGSTGTGRFDDYHGTSRGSGGDGGPEDQCNQPFTAMVEEVERCDYYRQHNALPEIGTRLTLRLGKRIRVETTQEELIGYLPTRFNYLAACLRSGYSYSGSVTSTAKPPILRVQVSISPVGQ